MSTVAEFTLELSTLIRRHYPGALKGEKSDGVAVCVALSTAIGAMLAFQTKLAKPEDAGSNTEAMVDAIMEHIFKSAGEIHEQAEENIRAHMAKKLN